jgi:hypothetical protein
MDTVLYSSEHYLTTFHPPIDLLSQFNGNKGAVHALGCTFVKRTAMVPVVYAFGINLTNTSGYPINRPGFLNQFQWQEQDRALIHLKSRSLVRADNLGREKLHSVLPEFCTPFDDTVTESRARSGREIRFYVLPGGP